MTFSAKIDNGLPYNGKLPGDIFDPGSETTIGIPMQVSNLSAGKHVITVSISQNSIFYKKEERTYTARGEFTIIAPDPSKPEKP